MGIGLYAAEMRVKAELQEILDWIDKNFNLDDLALGDNDVAAIRAEIQKRFDEPTEG